MKKILAVAGFIVAASMAGNAAAGCGAVAGDVRVGNLGQINQELSGKRINAVSPSGEDWKEDHCAGSALWKVGDGSAVDPRARRGNWTIVGTGNNRSVQYAYTGDGTYTWTLWKNGATLFFCNGSAEIARTVSIGAAGSPCD